MKYLALALIVLLLPLHVFAAGAELGAGYGGATTGSSRSASVTIPAGTDLFVVVAYRGKTAAGTSVAPTAVTVGGNSMTDVGQTPTGDQNTGWVKMFYYLSPPTGAQTVVANGSAGTNEITAFSWIAYSGFAQSGQPDSTGKLNDTTTTAGAFTTTVVGSECWAVMGATKQDTTQTYTNATGRTANTPNGGLITADSNGVVSPGSFTITVNQANQLINGVIASFCEKPVTKFAPWQFNEF